MTHLITSLSDQFMDRVFAIALADSVHFINKDFTDEELDSKVGVDWVPSKDPANKRRGAIPPGCVSALYTHSTHYTSVIQ